MNKIQETPLAASEFERQYIDVRKKEKLYFSDDEVARLPETPVAHPHYTKWKSRKNSTKRLTAYIDNAKKPLKILEVGCGNGWLSSKIAEIAGVTVTGTDINQTELKQASHVFSQQQNLIFVYGDIRENPLGDEKYDLVVFAASVQYFPSLTEIIAAASALLEPGGEIHILDSPFYDKSGAASARQRTKEYYESLGSPGMAAFYFHHTLNELRSTKHKILYNPFSIINKILRRRDPFYWICISK